MLMSSHLWPQVRNIVRGSREALERLYHERFTCGPAADAAGLLQLQPQQWEQRGCSGSQAALLTQLPMVCLQGLKEPEPKLGVFKETRGIRRFLYPNPACFGTWQGQKLGSWVFWAAQEWSKKRTGDAGLWHN